MENTLRNTSNEEATVMLRLAKEGVHPTEIHSRMRQEIPLPEEARRERAEKFALYLLSNLKLAIDYIECDCEATFKNGTIVGNANRLIKMIEEGV